MQIRLEDGRKLEIERGSHVYLGDDHSDSDVCLEWDDLGEDVRNTLEATITQAEKLVQDSASVVS